MGRQRVAAVRRWNRRAGDSVALPSRPDRGTGALGTASPYPLRADRGTGALGTASPYPRGRTGELARWGQRRLTFVVGPGSRVFAEPPRRLTSCEIKICSHKG